jgi:hypothetical protein
MGEDGTWDDTSRKRDQETALHPLGSIQGQHGAARRGQHNFGMNQRLPDRRTPLRRFIAMSLMTVAAVSAAKARSFEAEGSDTGAGLGARYVALGGTGLVASDDVYAIYLNPAGLVDVKGIEFALSRQLNAKLHPFNFVGIAWRLPLDERWAVRSTVAAAYYPRIHARAGGAFDEGDFESLFLRYLLPGISGTFDGDIDTKTKSYRVALGVAPLQSSRWSIGFYVERIDCRSTFCGVHATSNGFTTSSTGATAVGVGVGGRYRLSPNWTVAGSLSDLDTRLTLDSVTTDLAGTRTQQTRARFPRKIAAGAAWQPSSGMVIAAEYEITKGQYGKSEIDLQVMRWGVEKLAHNWAYRAGAMVPVKIESSMTGKLHAPFPFSPTVGLGWRGGNLKVDFALYAHAVMSMHKDAVVPAADLSLSISF